jgi:hypothetical protein
MPCPTMLLPPCYHAMTLPPMPCPYHAMTPPHALPLPFHATAAICCHPCHPMLCPQISAPKFRKPTQWWEHSGGGTIEGIIWEHNVDTLWGYNGEAQCGGTRWAQCRGTMWEHNNGRGTINLWGHNVGHGMPCPTLHCCHLLPFHAILCHPMPSHALPYHAAATMPPCCHAPTMLPCHDLTPMPCPYHAINQPHALPLPCHPLPSHAPTVLPLRSYSQR